MNKLLIICGPTATGKTELGIRLAKRFSAGGGGEIISADSRQVYRGMDIATGKDLPKGVRYQDKKIGSYLINGIRVWMLDVVDPKETFSVADYYNLAKMVIGDIWERSKLPIMVGGTGLYIKAVVNGIDTISIPRNERLRRLYEGKGIGELFEILAALNPLRAAQMNTSDRKNPRRLLRAIEIAQSKSQAVSMNQFIDTKFDCLFVGLTAPREELYRRINQRVDERVRQGAEGEVRKLIEGGVPWDSQSMTGLGYRQWQDYFEGKADKGQVIKNWKAAEHQYARRQMTWFKKDKRINWFDITKPHWQEKVEELAQNWYDTSDL